MLICLRQADSASRLYAKEFTFDKSLFTKQTIYQKLHNLNGNTFSFIPHVFFLSPQYCCFRSSEFNREETVTRTSTSLSFKFVRYNKTSLLLYAYKVIYLINKGVISPYVQEQGEILLKFNILRLQTSLSNTLLNQN